MTFRISITNEVNDDGLPVASMQFGDSVEHFPLVTSYWSPRDYFGHWKDSLVALAESSESSVAFLITSIENPSSSGGCAGFVFFREGNSVFVQQRLLSYDSLKFPFDENLPAHAIEQRRKHDDYGNRISEWQVSLSEIRAFLKAID